MDDGVPSPISVAFRHAQQTLTPLSLAPKPTATHPAPLTDVCGRQSLRMIALARTGLLLRRLSPCKGVPSRPAVRQEPDS